MSDSEGEDPVSGEESNEDDVQESEEDEEEDEEYETGPRRKKSRVEGFILDEAGRW